MTIEPIFMAGAYLLKPELYRDERGYFSRAFCKDELMSSGVFIDNIAQVNRSFNISKYTFRGLHYQVAPSAEEKIITCLNGHVLDIIVDIRKGSPTFLKYEFINLSSENQYSVLVPKGCAHGFLTLSINADLLYFHTASYNENCERSISIFDPLIKIKLPSEIKVISEKDRSHNFLNKNFKGVNV